MILYTRSYIILLSLLFATSLSLNASSIPPFWDGVLLTHKTDEEITAFIDQTEDIDNLVIIANIDGKRITHKVKDYGRLVSIAISPEKDHKGFILVKKLGFVVASVRLAEAMSSKEYYMNARISIMESKDKRLGHSFIPRRYAAIYKENEDGNKDEKLSTSDILSTENLNQGFTLVEERDPDKINAVIDTTQNYVYTPSTIILDENGRTAEIDPKDKSEKFEEAEELFYSALMLFEKYIHESRFPIYSFEERPKISKDISKDAKDFDNDYKVINDFHSWLYLEHKKTKEKYAFDGESIFRIEIDYFNIHYENEKEIKKFFKDNHFFIKPFNKKLLGIFYEKNELSALKSTEDYHFKVVEGNKLLITTGPQTYSIYNDDEFLIIKNQEKQIQKVNKAIFHQKEHFYYRE
ncbi:hypothetical protein [Flammeovirga sp. SJP92]|uniref:hypothetical protein n=1 Tax=Flammeovirga sp. SJP92 TaxID=1775430 RepID=UPI000787C92F|nr:hypothetical protein [Flammeovirga sp. SJP92]KXX70103.1 hypothetical protein AVL50_14630 [Flammeovirga sp. SJP92]